jgi:glycerol uptake facilitator-like aquaporin
MKKLLFKLLSLNNLKMRFPLLGAALAEMAGTTIFFSTILIQGTPIGVIVGLLCAIYIFAKSSFTHFNSALSVVMYLKGDIKFTEMMVYILAQIIGGIIALLFWRSTLHKQS